MADAPDDLPDDPTADEASEAPDPGGDERLFRQVERAKQEWEATFDAIGDGIAVVRPDGTVRRANRALARMADRSVRELPGSRWHDLWGDRAEPWPPAEEPRQFERLGETYRCFEETTHRGLADGDVILVVKDVTEQRLVAERMRTLHEETREANRALSESLERLRATQRQLVQAEKIATIGRLAAGLAHEINNPLGVVTSNLLFLDEHGRALLDLAEHLERLVPEDARPEAKQALEEADLGYVRSDWPAVLADASAGAERIHRIVTAIGAFAIGEAEGTPIDLRPVVDRAVEEALDRRGLPPTVAIRHDEVPPVVASPRQLGQAFGCLVDNALDACGPSKTVVRTRALDGDRVVIEITDAGPGVDPDAADRIFDPFVTTHPVGSHLGLGLSVAQAIAGRLGGEVRVESREDGRGTVASLILPASREA